VEKLRMGGLAELVSADESVVAVKPLQASFEEAAAIPLAALTSLQALREVAGLTAGQRVLIQAGAGGVGSLAIQIARILGLRVATTTSTRNVDFVRSIGDDEVIDYTRGEPLPTGFDAVFDTLGGASELASLAAVKRGGVVVGVGVVGVGVGVAAGDGRNCTRSRRRLRSHPGPVASLEKPSCTRCAPIAQLPTNG